MSAATNLLGSGAGVVTIVVGWLLMRHMEHAPTFSHPWLRRLIIVLMYAGGAALAVTSLGSLADSAIVWVAHFGGGIGYGLVHTLVVVAILVFLVGTVVSLIWSPDEATALAAIALPILLALPLGGVLHQVYTALDGPALSLATSINSWL